MSSLQEDLSQKKTSAETNFSSIESNLSTNLSSIESSAETNLSSIESNFSSIESNLLTNLSSIESSAETNLSQKKASAETNLSSIESNLSSIESSAETNLSQKKASAETNLSSIESNLLTEKKASIKSNLLNSAKGQKYQKKYQKYQKYQSGKTKFSDLNVGTINYIESLELLENLKSDKHQYKQARSQINKYNKGKTKYTNFKNSGETLKDFVDNNIDSLFTKINASISTLTEKYPELEMTYLEDFSNTAQTFILAKIGSYTPKEQPSYYKSEISDFFQDNPIGEYLKKYEEMIIEQYEYFNEKFSGMSITQFKQPGPQLIYLLMSYLFPQLNMDALEKSKTQLYDSFNKVIFTKQGQDVSWVYVNGVPSLYETVKRYVMLCLQDYEKTFDSDMYNLAQKYPQEASTIANSSKYNAFKMSMANLREFIYSMALYSRNWESTDETIEWDLEQQDYYGSWYDQVGEWFEYLGDDIADMAVATWDEIDYFFSNFLTLDWNQASTWGDLFWNLLIIYSVVVPVYELGVGLYEGTASLLESFGAGTVDAELDNVGEELESVGNVSNEISKIQTSANTVNEFEKLDSLPKPIDDKLVEFKVEEDVKEDALSKKTSSFVKILDREPDDDGDGDEIIEKEEEDDDETKLKNTEHLLKILKKGSDGEYETRFAQIVNYVKNMLDLFSEFISQTFKKFLDSNSFKEDISEEIEKIDPNAVDGAVKQEVDEIEEEMKLLTEKNFSASIINKLNEILNIIASYFARILNPIEKFITTILREFKYADMADTGNEIDSITAKLNKLNEDIEETEANPNPLNDIEKEKLTNRLSKIESQYREFLNSIEDKEVFEQYYKAKAAEKGDSLIGQYISGSTRIKINAILNPIGDLLGLIVDPVNDFFTTVLTKFKYADMADIGNEVDSITDKVDIFNKDISNLQDDIEEYEAGDLNRYTFRKVQEANSKIRTLDVEKEELSNKLENPLYKKYNEFLNSLDNDNKEVFEQYKKWAAEKGDSLIGQYISGSTRIKINAILNPIGDFVAKILDNINQFFSDILKPINQFFIDMYKSINIRLGTSQGITYLERDIYDTEKEIKILEESNEIDLDNIDGGGAKEAVKTAEKEIKRLDNVIKNNEDLIKAKNQERYDNAVEEKTKISQEMDEILGGKKPYNLTNEEKQVLRDEITERNIKLEKLNSKLKELNSKLEKITESDTAKLKRLNKVIEEEGTKLLRGKDKGFLNNVLKREYDLAKNNPEEKLLTFIKNPIYMDEKPEEIFSDEGLIENYFLNPIEKEVKQVEEIPGEDDEVSVSGVFQDFLSDNDEVFKGGVFQDFLSDNDEVSESGEFQDFLSDNDKVFEENDVKADDELKDDDNENEDVQAKGNLPKVQEYLSTVQIINEALKQIGDLRIESQLAKYAFYNPTEEGLEAFEKFMGRGMTNSDYLHYGKNMPLKLAVKSGSDLAKVAFTSQTVEGLNAFKQIMGRAMTNDDFFYLYNEDMPQNLQNL
ncbi:MAG: hypothetical protein ACXAAH_04535 [Promethearchaeota archaeon]|jgi:chromosome segregation ATPase